MELDKRVEFGPSEYNQNTFIPINWYIGNEEVTEMEYYGLTDKTTIEDLGPEPINCFPYDFSEWNEWKVKMALINK